MYIINHDVERVEIGHLLGPERIDDALNRDSVRAILCVGSHNVSGVRGQSRPTPTWFYVVVVDK